MKKVGVEFDKVTSVRPNGLIGLLLMTWPIIFVCFIQYTCLRHDYSLKSSVKSLGPFFVHFFNYYINPLNVSLKTVGYLLSWHLLQLLLYLYVPGHMALGRMMRSQHALTYKCNGLAALFVSNSLVILLWAFGVIDGAYFASHINEFLILSNFLGVILTIFVYFKAIIWPSSLSDTFFSGSRLYDLYCGVEHSPRIGRFDFKQFYNARVGIALWPLINLSYSCKMYQMHGYITSAMILLNILQFLYVFDLFYNEDWYMRTIDIAHDHFGFYLAWGDVAWLPFMYTLQGFYLMFHPIELSKFSLYIVSMLGFSSIYLFRKSNNQKEEFRNAKAAGNEFFILDRKADFIEAPYLSPDNKKQISFLLADGYWGISRHFNYLTDLGNALAYSLCCGTNCLLPYFYFIYMTILLLHRIERDDSRCSAKYKESWKQYCTKVPYKLIPYLY